jgi:serine/threonine-protein kinase
MHPEQVGPWRIERRLGTGGMGNVYLGTHTQTGEQAAVKVLPGSIAREEGFAERFSREIQALSQLSNRHVVAFLQNGVCEDGTLFYAMEYVDGPTLTAEIQSRKRLPWREVLDLALQAATALKAAHDAGVIHRDLKPSNLMLTRDRVLKLADFGVASLFASSRLTQAGSVIGTAEYMSPEQARGQRATPRSDLYSLGAVLYAMLTGRPPFSGATTGEILQKHQYSQFDRPGLYVPGIPRLLEELVCQLLEKDSAKRPPDALVVMRRLEQIRARINFAEEQLESETPLRSEVAATGQQSAERELENPDSSAASFEPAALPARRSRSGRRTGASATLLDNIYVLLALLAVLIAVSVWMVRRSTPTDDEQLSTAAALLDQPPGAGWFKARDEILLPLLNRQSDAEQQELIRNWIQQVDDYEFARSLQPDRRRSVPVDDELRRLIRRVFELHRRGETATARSELSAILVLLPTLRSPGFLEDYLQQTLTEWNQQLPSDGPAKFLQQLIEATQTKHPVGPLDQTARARLEAALLLYQSSPETASEAAKIRELLDRK